MSSFRSRAVTLPRDHARVRILQWMLALFVTVVVVSTADAQNVSRARSSRTTRTEDRSVRFDTTVAVEKGTILDVTAATGTIVVRGWDRNEIEVRAESESGEFQFSRSARSVRFEARRITRGRDEVSIQIRVPLNTRTVVANSSGEVQVLDVRGEVDANLLNGEVIIRGASGRTAISTVNAEVSITDVDGPLKVQSMTGEIALKDIRGDIEVLSSSGEVSMSGIQANHVQTEMVQGDIFFDGTLFRDDEMIATGTGSKTGRRMGHMPIDGDGGSLAALANVAARRIYMHINNTNPILVEGSPERLHVERNGWEVAEDGMEIVL